MEAGSPSGEESRRNGAMRPGRSPAIAINYICNLGRGPGYVVVHHDMVEPRSLTNLVPGRLQAPRQLLVALCVAGAQPIDQVLLRRRLEEDQDRVWHPLANRGRPLDVDLQQHVVPAFELVGD